MTERFQPKNPEESSIQPLLERGGLTPAHWEEVVRMIGKGRLDEQYEKSLIGRTAINEKLDQYTNPNNPIPEKIIAYAQKVMSGEFPDNGFHHRQYLGRRHWEGILRLDATDIIKIPRRLPPWPKTIKTENDRDKQSVRYSANEYSRTLTLNDYIDYLEKNLIPISYGYGGKFSSYYKWSQNEDSWRYIQFDEVDDRSRNDCDSIADTNSILGYWLMNPDEFSGGIVRMQSKVLGERLVTLAKERPELIKERLRSVLNRDTTYHEYDPPMNFGQLALGISNHAILYSENFGIVEKEIGEQVDSVTPENRSSQDKQSSKQEEVPLEPENDGWYRGMGGYLYPPQPHPKGCQCYDCVPYR